MLKGCQRKMIVVQGKDKSMFETAYFVLRRESESRGIREADMVAEANRIIDENRMPGRGALGCERWRRRLWGICLMLGGCCCGCGGTLLAVHFFGG